MKSIDKVDGSGTPPARMETPDAIAGLRALADQTRLQVARLLAEGAFNVGEIQSVLDLGQSTVSHHLKILTEAGLVGCRKEGRLSWYAWGGELTPAQAALQSFVNAHAQPLDADARTRLREVYEARVERTRRFFDESGLTPVPAIGKAPAPAIDVVPELLRLLPRVRVAVDLGTGGGRLLGPLRQRASRVIGVDQSPRMLVTAERQAAGEGWTDVELRLGTLEHLPLADGEADAAVAHQVLHHLARPEAAVVEAHRVLRAGGRLLLADYLAHEREGMREEYADLWLGFEPVEVARWLEAAGFIEVAVATFPGDDARLGMFVATGRRGPGGPALAQREPTGRLRRSPRKSPMRGASERTRRRRTAARGENP
jgi:SAM-dependent methyltransferase